MSSASVDASVEIPEGICTLTYERLNVDQIRQSVADDGAGATVLFVGSTRNSFQGMRCTSGYFIISSHCQGKQLLIWSTRHTAS
jgi:molybdopterin synthase catalytic subunit